MLTAHRIALNVNDSQETHLAKACGVARFAYNWALAEWQKQYEEHKKDQTRPKPTEGALRRLLNSIKREQFPWMLEVTKNAPQMAIIQLGKAFKNFFSGRTKYPQFRKKGVHDRFTLTNDQFEVEGSQIRIPNLGWIRMRETLRFSGKIVSAVISRVADRWFVSITIETPDTQKHPKINNSTVGVDLGISAMATLSSGEKIVGPKPHTASLRRLKQLSKALSRKIKGSKNRAKAKIKLARQHARISNIRLDAIHKFTTELVERFDTICIEDLNVQKMMKNRRLARSISDMGFREISRQLQYKTARKDGKLVIADRFFASSKTCANCGHVLVELPLSIRQWNCHVCGITHDRDVNAARNLAAYTVSSTVKACGESSSDRTNISCGETAPVKQEVNVNIYL
ncbi:MAG: IS200/IS605 family element transposase accessory protein TnpB [Chlamydiales bacterium]|nr:IS200/IS605 family element transposase accessory protein TnpB [Chlamydiales bacterium]